MIPYFPYYLTIFIQLIAVVHAIKSQKSMNWIYIIIFVPLIGSLAYFIVEILPGLSFSEIFFIKWISNLFYNPHQEIKVLEEELQYSNTIANKIKLADLYTQVASYDKAISLYQSCLSGLYANDANMIGSLAKIYFKTKQYDKSKEQYEKILALEKRLKPNHLLIYALCLDKLNKNEEANSIYQKLMLEHPGIEGNYHYLKFLEKNHQSSEIPELLRSTQRKYKQMHRYFQRKEQSWYNLIKDEFLLKK